MLVFETFSLRAQRLPKLDPNSNPRPTRVESTELARYDVCPIEDFDGGSESDARPNTERSGYIVVRRE